VMGFNAIRICNGVWADTVGAANTIKRFASLNHMLSEDIRSRSRMAREYGENSR
jgi:hypothetical protein